MVRTSICLKLSNCSLAIFATAILLGESIHFLTSGISTFAFELQLTRQWFWKSIHLCSEQFSSPTIFPGPQAVTQSGLIPNGASILIKEINTKWPINNWAIMTASTAGEWRPLWKRVRGWRVWSLAEGAFSLECGKGQECCKDPGEAGGPRDTDGYGDTAANSPAVHPQLCRGREQGPGVQDGPGWATRGGKRLGQSPVGMWMPFLPSFLPSTRLPLPSKSKPYLTLPCAKNKTHYTG